MGQRTLHSGEDADHDNPTPVAPKSARQVRPRGWVGSLPGDRSYPSVRDGAGAHDACLEALPAGLGAHRLWRADEQRSGGAGWEDSVAGGWLRLTRLLVVVPVVGDLYGHVHGGTGHKDDGRGADAAVALGGRADLVRVGTRSERHTRVAVEGAGDAAAVGEQQRDVGGSGGATALPEARAETGGDTEARPCGRCSRSGLGPGGGRGPGGGSGSGCTAGHGGGRARGGVRGGAGGQRQGWQ